MRTPPIVPSQNLGTPTQTTKRGRLEFSPGEPTMHDLMAVLKNVATKDDVAEIKDQFGVLSVQIQTLKEENNVLRSEIDQIKRTAAADHKELIRIIEQNKRKNLIFRGIKTEGPPKEEIKRICREKLMLSHVQIKETRIIYKRENQMGIIAEMDSEESVNAVLKNANKLIGTTIYVEQDLSDERQQQKRALIGLKRQLLSMDGSHRIAVRNDRIRIGTKWLKFNQNLELASGDQKAAEILSEIYGDKINGISLDFKSLLESSIQKI